MYTDRTTMEMCFETITNDFLGDTFIQSASGHSDIARELFEKRKKDGFLLPIEKENILLLTNGNVTCDEGFFLTYLCLWWGFPTDFSVMLGNTFTGTLARYVFCALLCDVQIIEITDAIQDVCYFEYDYTKNNDKNAWMQCPHYDPHIPEYNVLPRGPEHAFRSLREQCDYIELREPMLRNLIYRIEKLAKRSEKAKIKYPDALF